MVLFDAYCGLRLGELAGLAFRSGSPAFMAPQPLGRIGADDLFVGGVDPRQQLDDGACAVRLGRGEVAEEQRVLRDGETIVYQAIEEPYPFYQIYKQPLAGGKPERISTGRGRTTCSYFSPDGEWIVYQAFPVGYPFYQIYAQKLDERTPVRISPGRGRTTCSYFSPDGKSLIFQSTRDGRTCDQQYTMNIDGSDVKRITNEPGYDGGAFFSPDGTKILWRAGRPQNEESAYS